VAATITAQASDGVSAALLLCATFKFLINDRTLVHQNACADSIDASWLTPLAAPCDPFTICSVRQSLPAFAISSWPRARLAALSLVFQSLNDFHVNLFLTEGFFWFWDPYMFIA
jgi:hypothetical protein